MRLVIQSLIFCVLSVIFVKLIKLNIFTYDELLKVTAPFQLASGSYGGDLYYISDEERQFVIPQITAQFSWDEGRIATLSFDEESLEVDNRTLEFLPGQPFMLDGQKGVVLSGGIKVLPGGHQISIGWSVETATGRQQWGYGLVQQHKTL